MHPTPPAEKGFRRQVVFRVTPGQWEQLQKAAVEHGSLQAALIAGIHALSPAPVADREETTATVADLPEPRKPKRPAEKPAPRESVTPEDPDQEITSAEAAQILGVKTGTVSGYIRSGRLEGRYGAEPDWRGWLTTRRAVDAYRLGR